PKGTPPEVIAKLNAAIVEALADPQVQQRFRDVGQEVWPKEEQNPAGLAAKQKAEMARWRRSSRRPASSCSEACRSRPSEQGERVEDAEPEARPDRGAGETGRAPRRAAARLRDLR